MKLEKKKLEKKEVRKKLESTYIVGAGPAAHRRRAREGLRGGARGGVPRALLLPAPQRPGCAARPLPLRDDEPAPKLDLTPS